MNNRELKNWADKAQKRAEEELEMREFLTESEVGAELEAVIEAMQDLSTACESAQETRE
jgi:hypothetical protein